jgi:hypothetical protein
MDGAELPMQGFFTRAKVQDLIDDVIRYVELNWLTMRLQLTQNTARLKRAVGRKSNIIQL